MSGAPVIYRARRILTMDAAMPVANAIAVVDGRILHTGMYDDVIADLTGTGATTDERYADAYLTPGFIEAHSHIFAEAALAAQPWVGSYDRWTADGIVQPGCASVVEVLARLREVHSAMVDQTSTLVAMGWDPSMAGNDVLTGDLLDQVSVQRPIFVLHASLHIGVGNQAMMQLAGITRDTRVEGLMTHADGEPNGELRENALGLVLGRLVPIGDTTTLPSAGVLARMVGCTTVSDFAASPTPTAVATHRAAVLDDSFQSRVVYAPSIRALNDRLGVDTFSHVMELARFDTGKFRMGPVKFMIDGSIQGRTARMNWPGYCCGDPNGIWLWDSDELFESMLPYHEAGLQIALHANGDEAVDRGLDIFERLLTHHPRFDHRHRLEHAQLASELAFRRMKALGVGVNLFANHVYYWGETHRTQTAGPGRARSLDAGATAQRIGVPFSFHSDAPVTPLNPLFTMWCAVNRLTSQGRVLGPQERISGHDALRAMTINAAILLKTDRDTGSLEVGKFADCTVLSDDPTTCEPHAIKDIRVLGTMLAGRDQPNP